MNESELLFDVDKSIFEFCIKYYLSRFSGKSFCSKKSWIQRCDSSEKDWAIFANDKWSKNCEETSLLSIFYASTSKHNSHSIETSTHFENVYLHLITLKFLWMCSDDLTLNDYFLNIFDFGICYINFTIVLRALINIIISWKWLEHFYNNILSS